MGSQRLQWESVLVLYGCIKTTQKLRGLKHSFHFAHNFVFQKFGWLISDLCDISSDGWVWGVYFLVVPLTHIFGTSVLLGGITHTQSVSSSTHGLDFSQHGDLRVFSSFMAT